VATDVRSMTIRSCSLSCVLLLSTLVSQLVAETDGLSASSADENIAGISLLPAHVQLGGVNRRQQLLLTAEMTDGRRIDVTSVAEFAVDRPEVASVEGAVVRAQTAGTTTLVARFAGHEQRVTVQVGDVAGLPSVDFGNDLVPLFSKLGCNSGGCHGKQSGQGGFRLSVFGFDPQADYESLVRADRGRRLFPSDPPQSLLVRKATGSVPHGGGRRVEPGSWEEQLLTEWIRQGTPRSSGKAAVVDHLMVTPTERVLGPNSTQQLLVTAVYSDGRHRDVTSTASYTTNAEMVVGVDQEGSCRTGNSPGEAAVTVNYMGHVSAVRLIVPRVGARLPEMPPANNPIDVLVWEKLAKLNISPSELCDDATFLRRLHVKTIGTLPTPDEVRDFISDASPDKRQRAIEHVLSRPEFADYWAGRWADVLLVDEQTLGDRGAYELHQWLRRQFAENRPYDEWVRELLTASGSSAKVGPVNFYRALRTPEELTRAVSQAFLGVRLDCAQCHHHPFDKWGQQDFYGMAGFFTGIERTALSDDRELIYHSGHKPALFPSTNELVPTRPLEGEPPAEIERGDPRRFLAEWMTADDNPYFARLVANRTWKQLMGRGLVEPEDDLRLTNPAGNEPLLAWLTEQVQQQDYDLKAVMRLVLESRAFQLSSAPNETNRRDTQNHSHYLVRRLPAAVLLDAICEVTESPEPFVGMPAGTRAVELWNNRLPSYFLDIFGRSPRQSPCECGTSGEPTMSQALHLMNAPEIDAKIRSPEGRAARMVESGIDRETLVNELCLAALGRPAGDRERRVAEQLFAAEPDRQAAEDFLWALLNSYDFLFVH